ncbi:MULTISPECIES: O-succinylhomoserine sulfhydrylase [unclassified Snodgrassella]|uniref:O-succinylhomoserine sulfhydrylase n=1 Tax=unclassified Snodgrassella TaxID=2625236 RepID=UPI0018DD19F9|nr:MULTISPECIES: O-succinylhomoserine sulfhydrylase [unclassified Snodgrassella]MBI0097087.1 O-succinylhomoserine sulfhydrylase [Snodgrassella sp. W8134]MBI0101180.1 O-succinylhomoserine sulfhydrylase [Snodgrassella sp. W8135]
MSTLQLHPETIAIRGAKEQTPYNEHNSALFLTSSFMFENAETGASLFAGSTQGYTYTRTNNPTVAAFQARVAQLEQGEAGLATSTGMAAINATFLALLKAGDHLVASKSLFGTTIGLLNNILPRFGIEVTLVSQTDITEWRSAIRPNTRMLFVETPSNPLNELADITKLAEIAHNNQAILVVDNSFLSPALQQPLRLGADLSVESATKAIDGHGRVMGGVICGSAALVNEIFLHVRTTGEVLSPFNAWILLSGLETLYIRMEKQCANALEVAQFLSTQPRVITVHYTGLSNHPQKSLVQKQQQGGGIVVAFEVKGGEKAAWQVIDMLTLFSKTGNLGDVKSTVTHPWTTTHGRMPPEAKLEAGIQPGLIRLSVGLEHASDLKADLANALSKINI